MYREGRRRIVKRRLSLSSSEKKTPSQGTKRICGVASRLDKREADFFWIYHPEKSMVSYEGDRAARWRR